MNGHNNTNNMKYRMRTVVLNERGQIVIPEEIRADLGLNPGSTLVMLEMNGELLLKKELEVVKHLALEEEEQRFWRALSHRAMERAWDEKDQAWEAHAPRRVP